MGLENNIPEDWIETTLEENISVIAMGPFGSNLKRDMFTKEGVPIIKGTNLSGMYVGGDFTFVSEEKAISLRKAVAYPNDIIITHRGTIGQVSLVPQNKYKRYVTSQSQLRFSPDPQKLDYKYILYFLRSRVGQYELLKSSSQVGVPAIATPTKSIKEINLFLPPLPEQKAIAKVLTAFDDKIELLQAQNKTLETMAQTIFKEWFGKYQIGDELPEGWRLDSLGKAVKIKQGKYVKSEKISEIQNHEFKYPVYGGGGVRGYLQSYVYDTPQVILTCRGNGCGLIQLSKNYSTITNSCMTLECDNSKLDFTFLYLFSKNINFEIYTSGSAQPQITVTNLEGLEIIIPNEIILKKFKGLVEPLFKKMKTNYYQIKSLSKTRDTLLPKLMSGQVRVNNLQQAADA